jgi:hypothetical protein
VSRLVIESLVIVVAMPAIIGYFCSKYLWRK